MSGAFMYKPAMSGTFGLKVEVRAVRPAVRPAQAHTRCRKRKVRLSIARSRGYRILASKSLDLPFWDSAGRLERINRFMAPNDCSDQHKQSENGGENRRTMLSWLLGGGVLASMASFLYPVIRFLNPPLVTEAAVNEVDGGKVQDLMPNSGKIVRFGSKPALLVRVSETEWKAFSAVCTHLHCTVQYRAATHQIWCPCHNGTYNMNGTVVSGPPPNPLEEYAVNIRAGEVWISRRA
jgi:Rieske Fe-S protein